LALALELLVVAAAAAAAAAAVAASFFLSAWLVAVLLEVAAAFPPFEWATAGIVLAVADADSNTASQRWSASA